MRFLGNLVRGLLNINTIWGLMILTAFVLSVVQHYMPTSTVIPGDQIQPGQNTLTIQLEGDDKPASHSFALTQSDGGLHFDPAPDDKPAGDAPWIVALEAVNEDYILTWDARAHGDYVVAVNGTGVRRGSLVTLSGLTEAALDYARVGFDIALGLVATMVLFLGLMKVGEAAGIVQLVARVFHPIIRFLFSDVPKDHPASGAILMNITCNVLGLGNAATPFGLKAMKHLQSLNPHPEIATNAQIMLLAINTAGFAMIPTTLLAIRQGAGCTNPFEIIGPCMFAGGTATITAIIAAKLLSRLPFFTVQAALAESPTQEATA